MRHSGRHLDDPAVAGVGDEHITSTVHRDRGQIDQTRTHQGLRAAPARHLHHVVSARVGDIHVRGPRRCHGQGRAGGRLRHLDGHRRTRRGGQMRWVTAVGGDDTVEAHGQRGGRQRRRVRAGGAEGRRAERGRALAERDRSGRGTHARRSLHSGRQLHCRPVSRRDRRYSERHSKHVREAGADGGRGAASCGQLDDPGVAGVGDEDVTGRVDRDVVGRAQVGVDVVWVPSPAATSTARLLSVSAMNTSPAASTATPAG